jgi:hypothetical protein
MAVFFITEVLKNQEKNIVCFIEAVSINKSPRPSAGDFFLKNSKENYATGVSSVAGASSTGMFAGSRDSAGTSGVGTTGSTIVSSDIIKCLGNRTVSIAGNRYLLFFLSDKYRNHGIEYVSGKI